MDSGCNDKRRNTTPRGAAWLLRIGLGVGLGAGLPGVALAAALLQGLVVQNEEYGQPLANVEVSAPGADTTTSGSDGLFHLRFAQAQPGDKVRLAFMHSGWAVVNEWALEMTLPSVTPDEPVELILCRSNELEKRRLHHYRVQLWKTIEDQYQQQMAALTGRSSLPSQELSELKRRSEQVSILTYDYSEQLSEAWENNVDVYYREAHALLLAGKLDELLRKLGTATSAQSPQLAQNEQLRALALVLKLDFTGANKAYLTVTQTGLNDPDLWHNKAKLHQAQQQLTEADSAYRMALTLYRQQVRTNPGYQPGMANTLYQLSRMRLDPKDRAKALADVEEALAIWRQLAEYRPVVYQPKVAKAISLLGELRASEGQASQALVAFEEVLMIWRQLAQVDPSLYLSKVARTLNQLGKLHSEGSRRTQAMAVHKEALSILREIARTEPDYISDVAQTLSDLGDLNAMIRPAQALLDYEESIRLRRELARTAPSRQLPALTVTLNNLALVHAIHNRIPQAKAAYEEALDIERQQVRLDSKNYLPILSVTLDGLGTVYRREKQYAQSLAAYEEALSIQRELVAENFDASSRRLAIILNNLGILHALNNRLTQAAKAFEESVSIHRQLVQLDPDNSLALLASGLRNLGRLHGIEKRTPQALAAYEEALEIYKKLDRSSPIVFISTIESIERAIEALKTAGS